MSDTVYLRVHDGWVNARYHRSWDCATAKRGGRDPSDGNVLSVPVEVAEDEYDAEPCGRCGE